MSIAAMNPETYSRRSFVYHRLQRLGARFAETAGAAVAMSFGDEEREIEQAGQLALADLSLLHRAGFKGAGVDAWLLERGLNVPAESNRAVLQDDGVLMARLSPAEMLILDDVPCESSGVENLRAAWRGGADVPSSAFTLPREDSHAWFGLVGVQCPAMLAKLCAVDLRPAAFANGAVAQTSVARLAATVIRSDLGRTLHYHLLADSAAAGYLWDCLVDAMAEYKGEPVGLAALRRLCRESG